MPIKSTATSGQAPAREASGLSSKKDVRVRATRIVAAVIALLIMLALKRHYSLASVDQLNWILAPTAKLLAWLTPAHPVYENGVGYVDFSQGIVVAPACAGINFMIMAFGLMVLCAVAATRGPASMAVWLSFSSMTAYGYTLLVNTARIAMSMALYKADIYGGWITPERVHRLAGIGLYLGALWILFTGIRIIVHQRCTTCRPGTSSLPLWLPFCWYVVGAVGVPLANQMFQDRSPSFGEHVLTVVITVLCLWGLSAGAKKVLARARKRLLAMPSHHDTPERSHRCLSDTCRPDIA